MADGSRVGALRWAATAVADSPWRWTGTAVFLVVMATTRGITLPPTIAVCIAGTTVWIIARHAPPEARPDVGPIAAGGLAAWATILVIFTLWEAAAFFLGNDDAHPTFSMLTDGFFAFSPTRTLAALGWLTWGWYLLER